MTNDYMTGWRKKNADHIKRYSKLYHLLNKEALNEKSKIWRSLNPQKVKLNTKRWAKENKERWLELQRGNSRKYHAVHRKTENDRVRKWTKTQRDLTLDFMGGRCIKCGFSDYRALQIDHINGDGSSDKRTSGGGYFRRVLESVKNQEDKYQLLCANCNFIKRYENKEFRKG